MYCEISVGRKMRLPIFRMFTTDVHKTFVFPFFLHIQVKCWEFVFSILNFVE
jgi:hypothetical protein